MKTIVVIIMIGSFVLAACAAPPTPTATPTLAATATNTPEPTSTPLPTSTPAPKAVPLVYKGWEDQAFAVVCLDSMTVMGTSDVNARILNATQTLLEEMGMRVVRDIDYDDPQCEAIWVWGVGLEANCGAYTGGGTTCTSCTGADLYGDLVLMKEGEDGQMWDVIRVPIEDSVRLAQSTNRCVPESEAPFDRLWPKMVVESFMQVYGSAVLDAARNIPELQAVADMLAESGK